MAISLGAGGAGNQLRNPVRAVGARSPPEYDHASVHLATRTVRRQPDRAIYGTILTAAVIAPSGRPWWSCSLGGDRRAAPSQLLAIGAADRDGGRRHRAVIVALKALVH
jgi:hypothetical protein